jgi:hypothetical protein
VKGQRNQLEVGAGFFETTPGVFFRVSPRGSVDHRNAETVVFLTWQETMAYADRLVELAVVIRDALEDAEV